MSARENILTKLRAANATPLAEPQTREYYAEMTPHWDTPALRLQHWAATMRKVKGEIVWCHKDTWTERFAEVVAEKGINNIVLPLQAEHGQSAASILQHKRPVTQITAFDRKLEDWKDELFANVDGLYRHQSRHRPHRYFVVVAHARATAHHELGATDTHCLI